MTLETEWQLSPLHSGRTIRLKNLLQHLSGFNALILQYNDVPYRNGLIDWIFSNRPDDSTQLDLKHLANFTDFEQQLEKLTPHHGLIQIINLDSLTEKQIGAFFKGINYHREQLAAIASNTTLVFWLPDPLIKQMALEAADFWAWREQVFDFSLPLDNTPRWAANFKNTTGLELAEKQKRIQEINDYLHNLSSDQITMISTADLYHELGNLYQNIGHYASAKAQLHKALAIFSGQDETHAYARVLRDIAELQFAQGLPDEALTALEKKVLPWFIKLNDLAEQAGTQGRIADIYQARGELDKALDIRKNDELPVFEKLGDVREKAVTMGKIADIYQARGELDKALDIRKNDELPVFEKLGDVREKAVTMGKIADIYQARGELDKALDIRKNDELPVFEKLGDVRSKAVTMGKIADIYQARGELDKALDIRKNDELPVYEKLGDVRAKAITMGEIADIYQARGELDKALDIRKNDELPVYEKLGDVRGKAVTMGKIADIYQARGELDKALDIRKNDELPVYEKLGDVHSLLVGRTNIAILLWQIDSTQHLDQINELLNMALADAQRLRIPEAGQIEGVMQQMGLSTK